MGFVAVIGAGESGVGAAILAKEKGWKVWVSDYGRIKDRYQQDLLKYEIPFEEEGHNEKKILEADLVIKSPGVSPKTKIIKAIREKGIPVVSEIEFGYRYTDAKIIGITGSNGKTTTTLLTYHLLKAAGLNVGLGGNIGDSFAKSVALKRHDYYVLEISSFQLEDIQDFRCDIAMLLNITPDHLDRYDYDVMEYARTKLRITNIQAEDDLFIFNGLDPICKEMIKDETFQQRMMPVLEPIIHDTSLHLGGNTAFDLMNFKLKGRHNIMNLSFALLAALDLGIDSEALQNAIPTFENAPHRMEVVSELKGVTYINDSKATNVDAVFYALNAMEDPTLWIVGGVDKGNDYEPLMDLIKSKVKVIICLGIDNRKLYVAFEHLGIPMYDVKDIDKAVAIAQEMATEEDIVLLSPACASFDLFDNYEHRGDLFRSAVKALA
ncbi:MAG: UDP-N-acetylmuramoyl-L-alanine--D-glutamate ligase [Bacteroidia bacterium]|nr:UDP-N-acetylmuramoyl-L-alanine--D-glutamate ligase [Bacteroidia bacterium]